MAIISSYPVVTPQLADQVLGSNTVDSVGQAVIGTPTVQYSLTSVKAVVDQAFKQQLSSTSNESAVAGIAASQAPAATNTIHNIIFGLASGIASSPVKIDAAGLITFQQVGTYYIEFEAYLQATANNNIFTLFRIWKDNNAQFGPTQVERHLIQASTDSQKVLITQMVEITAAQTWQFQMLRDEGGANSGTLVQILNNNGWTTTPNAQITISKLI